MALKLYFPIPMLAISRAAALLAITAALVQPAAAVPSKAELDEMNRQLKEAEHLQALTSTSLL